MNEINNSKTRIANNKNNSRKPHKKAPCKKILQGAFGYCLLTDTRQGIRSYRRLAGCRFVFAGFLITVLLVTA